MTICLLVGLCLSGSFSLCRNCDSIRLVHSTLDDLLFLWGEIFRQTLVKLWLRTLQFYVALVVTLR
jgi:hypothetical protein